MLYYNFVLFRVHSNNMCHCFYSRYTIHVVLQELHNRTGPVLYRDRHFCLRDTTYVCSVSHIYIYVLHTYYYMNGVARLIWKSNLLVYGISYELGINGREQ